MDKQTKAVIDAMSTLLEDAHALMAATADVAGERVGDARKRLASALESGKNLCVQASGKARDAVKVADRTVHEYPYQAIGIAMGAGALIGYLAARECRRNDR